MESAPTHEHWFNSYGWIWNPPLLMNIGLTHMGGYGIRPNEILFEIVDLLVR